MAIGTTLPPRAYTREILTAAFNWLQTQPDSVRTKATTPDALVGLYTRAQRFGSVAEAEAPVSSQNFMSDLKNLAEGLKAFDGAKVQLSATEAAIAGPLASSPQAPGAAAPLAPAAMPATAAASTAAQPAAAFATQAAQPAPAAQHAAAAKPASAFAAQSAAPASASAVTANMSLAHSATSSQASTAAMPAPLVLTGLNERAIAMLQEVQSTLNLSSESEAANMMIALAYKTLKSSLLS